jgi:starch-binding outer membrane protein, SusD/RagB family
MNNIILRIMKNIIYLFASIFILSSCNKLDILPASILQDKDVFTSDNGIAAYMSTLYVNMPLEDSKYNLNEGDGFMVFSWNQAIHNMTGEGMNKNVGGMITGAQNQYWDRAYQVVRYANYFLENFPAAVGTNMDPVTINHYKGEARFLRAYTYFGLAKRYGGVPIIKKVQNFPEQSLTDLQLPRNSEQEVWDYIGEECDSAYILMKATSDRGRANKYVAAGLKSRAMLFAGSIAKYNAKNIADPATNKRVQGIPASEAVRYFKASYDASKLVALGGYQLYRPTGDKMKNFTNLFFDVTGANKEDLFIREYILNNACHSLDVFAIPRQLIGADGYSSYVCPTLDFVELFDGLPKNPDGSLNTLDPSGNYVYYDTRYSLFQNAEPRLLATIMVPGVTFKGQEINIRRGVYTGSIAGGIRKFPTVPFGTVTNYALIPGLTPCTGITFTPQVTIPDFGSGTTIMAGGTSGMYGTAGQGTYSGFTTRKMVNEATATVDMRIGKIVTPWPDMRYAEILLNRAEAAYELFSLGQADVDYVQDAFTCIDDIQERAGAVRMADKTALNSINIIRKERKKELGFENKIYWDMKRWRTFDTEVMQRQWFVLCPFYVAANGKYIFDRRYSETGSRFTFPLSMYYENIPGAAITKNPLLYQNQ